MAGQMAVALAGPGEVGVQPAAGRADVGGGALQQPGSPEPVERGEPVAGLAVLVDVEHVRSGCAGRDGEVAVRVPGEPLVICRSLVVASW